MPIVDVEIVGVNSSRAGGAQQLADALGNALGSRPRGTWVRVRHLDASAYAENSGAEPDVAPIFVSVQQADVPEGSALEDLARRLCVAVADVCERPAGQVHVVFEPALRGRIAFGGQLYN